MENKLLMLEKIKGEEMKEGIVKRQQKKVYSEVGM